jgi:RNA polymerase sigma-70 factor (ECF subfamily)
VKVSDADEAQLLRRIGRADLEAFEELYRRTSPWLALRLGRRCADQGLVAEVLQDTYLSVWQTAGSFCDLRGRPGQEGSPAGWLWTIAARRLVDGLRRQGRYREIPADVLPAGLTSSAPGADDEALASTVGDEVGAALADLAPELRDVLRAMVLDGLTVRETSVLLCLPEGTVKTRARRARSLLRKALS